MAAALLAGAVASSTPVARWCPMPWDHVPAAIYLRCTLFSASGVAHFALAPASEAAAACTLGRVAAGSHSMSSCSGGACGAPHCPKRASEPARDRAYCLSDPGLASSWRPSLHAPRNPAPAVAVLIAAPALPAPASAIARTHGFEGDAQPPGAEPAARPPVRAPPTLSADA